MANYRKSSAFPVLLARRSLLGFRRANTRRRVSSWSGIARFRNTNPTRERPLRLSSTVPDGMPHSQLPSQSPWPLWLAATKGCVKLIEQP